jgi:hypothetical protein
MDSWFNNKCIRAFFDDFDGRAGHAKLFKSTFGCLTRSSQNGSAASPKSSIWTIFVYEINAK